MRNSRQAGFFLWEALLAGGFLLLMAASVGLYAKAVTAKSAAAGQAAAVFLARAQFSYAQSKLDKEGGLPPEMPYLGAVRDLEQNGLTYHLDSKSRQAGHGWQLQVTVSWEVQGRVDKVAFARILARHGLEGAAGDGSS